MYQGKDKILYLNPAKVCRDVRFRSRTKEKVGLLVDNETQCNSQAHHSQPQKTQMQS